MPITDAISRQAQRGSWGGIPAAFETFRKAGNIIPDEALEHGREQTSIVNDPLQWSVVQGASHAPDVADAYMSTPGGRVLEWGGDTADQTAVQIGEVIPDLPDSINSIIPWQLKAGAVLVVMSLLAYTFGQLFDIQL